METTEVKFKGFYYDVTYFWSETYGVEISKITDWEGKDVTKRFDRDAIKDIENLVKEKL